MAIIRETLILEDQFTAPFTRYITLTQQAAGGTSQAESAVARLAYQQDSAAKSTSSLMSAVKGLVGAYMGLKGLSALVGMSDAMTTTTARLNLMNDGLQTTKELTDMIFASANRARGSYTETAAMVSKLGTLAGDAFDSSAEIVGFVEQINKQMAISGTSTAEAQGAMLQLTQAMSSGVLRGEELNSVMEQTPMIAQTIAEYLGVSTGEMRELASEGKITADIVKNAMFAAADETNSKFEQMPMTWGQVWTQFQNYALKGLQPVLSGISLLANNVEILIPLVLSLAGAFGLFQVAAHWTTIATVATSAYVVAVNLLPIAFGVVSGSAAAASAAVFTFNNALFASPITWIVGGIMLLVGLLYAAVAAYNKLTGASVSATGVIAGGITAAITAVGNMVLFFINMGIKVHNFLLDVFTDVSTGLLNRFLSLAKGIEAILNSLPGIEVSFTSGIENAISQLEANRSAKTLATQDYMSISDAYKMGYDWGANLFSGAGGESDWTGGATLDDLDTTLGGISDSVGSIEKSVNMSQEDVAMLVDMASRRYVNRINLTAQTPIITINGANTGNTEADRKALADALKKILLEQAAAGSYRSTARIY